MYGQAVQHAERGVFVWDVLQNPPVPQQDGGGEDKSEILGHWYCFSIHLSCQYIKGTWWVAVIYLPCQLLSQLWSLCFAIIVSALEMSPLDLLYFDLRQMVQILRETDSSFSSHVKRCFCAKKKWEAALCFALCNSPYSYALHTTHWSGT